MNDTHGQNLELLMIDSLKHMKQNMIDVDISDVQEYIDHGEYGVAWDLMWHIAINNKINIPDALISSGKIMGLDVSH